MTTKLRHTPKDKKSKLPKKYVAGLTPKQKGSMFSIFINTYEVLKEGLFVCQIQLAAT